MEESTAPDSNSSPSKQPAPLQYDDAVLRFAETRIPFRGHILKYRELIKKQELANLKKLTYADLHQLVPDVETSVVPQLIDQNEKRIQLVKKMKLEEDFEQRNQNVRNELSMISKILLHLEKEKERLH